MVVRNRHLPYGVLKLPSASELQRLMACPSSVIGAGITAETSEAAARGTTVHEFIRRVLSGEAPDEVLKTIPLDDPGRLLCEQLDLTLLPAGGEHEVAVAWDPRTQEGRILGKNIGRDYEGHGAEREREFVGSADFVGLRDDGWLVVLDYKTGRAPKAAENWQVVGLGVFFADAIRVDGGVKGVIVGVGAIGRDGIVRWDVEHLSALSVAAARVQLQQAAQGLGLLHDIPLEQAALKEGGHCFFCPMWKRCPAKVGLIRAMGVQVFPETMQMPSPHPQGRLGEEGLQEVSDQVVAHTFVQIERWEAALKRVREEVEAYAAHRPLELGDGRTLKLAFGDMRDQILDGPKTVQALSEETDEQCAADAIRTNKGAIEDAVAAYARRNDQPIAKLKKAVVEALRGRGLIIKLHGEEKVRVVRGKMPRLASGSESG